jgi:hypothetical protein
VSVSFEKLSPSSLASGSLTSSDPTSTDKILASASSYMSSSSSVNEGYSYAAASSKELSVLAKGLASVTLGLSMIKSGFTGWTSYTGRLFMSKTIS